MQDAMNSIAVAAGARTAPQVFGSKADTAQPVPTDETKAFKKVREFSPKQRSYNEHAAERSSQRQATSSKSPSQRPKGPSSSKPLKPRMAVLQQQKRQRDKVDGPQSPLRRSHDAAVQEQSAPKSAAEQSIRNIQAFLERKQNKVAEEVATGKRSIVGREHTRRPNGKTRRSGRTTSASSSRATSLPGIRDHLESR